MVTEAEGTRHERTDTHVEAFLRFEPRSWILQLQEEQHFLVSTCYEIPYLSTGSHIPCLSTSTVGQDEDIYTLNPQTGHTSYG